MRTLLFLPALALVACGTDSSSPDGPASRPDDNTVTADVAPCDALTAEMIAGAFEVPASAVTLDQEAMESSYIDTDEQCVYDVESETFDGASITVKGYDDAQIAESTFSGQYRTRTDADLEQIREAGDKAAEQAVAEGQIDEGDLEGVDTGAMLSGLVGKFSFEPLEGVGDQAVVEINAILDPALPTTVHIRSGAAIYSVEAEANYFYSQEEANVGEIRARLTDLGQRVGAAL